MKELSIEKAISNAWNKPRLTKAEEQLLKRHARQMIKKDLGVTAFMWSMSIEPENGHSYNIFVNDRTFWFNETEKEYTNRYVITIDSARNLW